MITTKTFKLFDSHFHIIDKRFPLVKNDGFLPDYFSCDEYHKRVKDYHLAGGAIVSGSFQGLDQSYLLQALETLGPSYVGVTQLPMSVSDEEIIKLNQAGVRGVRFNLKRGGSEGVENLERFAQRIYDVAGWHAELYVDSNELPSLSSMLLSLPIVSIAHLGLSGSGFSSVLKLVEGGVKVKATGFYRVDFEVKTALQEIVAIDDSALFFGTDLPSTRANRPYYDEDYYLVEQAVGADIARKVFYDNAVNFYKPHSSD